MIKQRNINLFFVLLFTAYTAYTIFYRQAGFFFIIYLFWFDEVIRNVSLLAQVKLYKRSAPAGNPLLARARATILSRFFFLFVYAVFIVIVFGIFFHLDKASRDKLLENLRIIMLTDPVFNLCLCIFIVREVMLMRVNHIRHVLPDPGNAMDGHMLTMHLSILFGGCLYVLTSGKQPFIHLSLGSLTPYALILPFIIIKFIVDVNATRKGAAGN